MAYTVRKGNQVAIVHGERVPGSGSVQQRNLFTLRSKSEAEAAIGSDRDAFRQLLEHEHPALRLNWAAIDAGIRTHMAALPDVPDAGPSEDEQTFRAALVAFTRELLIQDPQSLVSYGNVAQTYRNDLEYLRQLIAFQLQHVQTAENQLPRNNSFRWQVRAMHSEVPPDAHEELSELLADGKYEATRSRAQLLLEAWPNFAPGHNYLGLVAQAQGDFLAAARHFGDAIRVGRTLFPKRIRKSSYWSDHATRPYIRGLLYLSMAYNRLGRYDEALALCDQLDQECGQDMYAATGRAPAFLNAGRWSEAAAAGRYMSALHAESCLLWAFALYELDQKAEATLHFVHASLRSPHAARILAGVRKAAPSGSTEIRDHNTGVQLKWDIAAYLQRRGASQFFAKVLRDPAVAAAVDEAILIRRKWSADRSGDRTWFERMHVVESLPFAEGIVTAASIRG